MDIVEIRMISLVALLGGVGLASFFLGWFLGKKSVVRRHATLQLDSHDCDSAETVVTLTDGSAGAICAYVYPDGAIIDPQPPDTCGLVQPTGTGMYTITGVGHALGATGNVRVVVWTVDTHINAATTCGSTNGSGMNGGGGTDTGTEGGTSKAGSGIGTGIGP